MPDIEKTLTRRLDKLAARLDEIEKRVNFRPGESAGAIPAGGAPPAAHAMETARRLCRLPEVPVRPITKAVSETHERLIRVIEKKWVNGTHLKFAFFKGSPFGGAAKQMDYVREAFEIWADVGIGLTFEEVSETSDAHVRVGFQDGDGSWSYVGRDVADIPGKLERTMNIGWDLDLDPRGVNVAVHEIGHTLGFPHEHQNPFSGIVWDEAAVYRYFGGPPNNWTREQIFHNVMRKLPASDVEGSQWDPNSIMHYDFEPGLILEPAPYRAGLTPAGGLSAIDIDEVRKFYPPLNPASYRKLSLFRSEPLSLAPAEQADFIIEPDASREHTIQTFGESDVVMVLFEEKGGKPEFVAGDDDSGGEFNAKITEWLKKGSRYILRIRMYLTYDAGDCAVMYW